MLGRLLRTLCWHRRGLLMLFSVHLMILVALVAALPAVDQGTGSYVATVLALSLSLVTVLVTGGVLLLCKSRQETRPREERTFDH